MPEHIPEGGLPTRKEHGHGNRWHIKSESRRPQTMPTVRKVPADSVPYGTDICTRGNSVWAAYDGDVVVAVAPTADEARKKWRTYRARKGDKGSSEKS